MIDSVNQSNINDNEKRKLLEEEEYDYSSN